MAVEDLDLGKDVSYLQYASCSVLERWWSVADVVPASRSALSLDEKVINL